MKVGARGRRPRIFHATRTGPVCAAGGVALQPAKVCYSSGADVVSCRIAEQGEEGLPRISLAADRSQASSSTQSKTHESRQTGEKADPEHGRQKRHGHAHEFWRDLGDLPERWFNQ